MTSGLVVLTVLLCALLLSSAAAGPATDRTRRRTESRRRRYVHHHPRSATAHDIHRLLVDQGMAGAQAWVVVERAAELRITPFTMWLWLEQFDAEALGLVVGADLTTAELVGHMCHGTVPDLEELRIFAAANGLEIDSARTSPRIPATLARTTLVKSLPGPIVYAPGVLPDGTRLRLSGPLLEELGRSEPRHGPRDGDRGAPGGLAA